MNEFKFCPFKKFLPNAVKLENDEIAQDKANPIRNLYKRNTIMVKDDNLDEDELDKKLTNFRKLDEVNNEDKLEYVNYN